MPMRMPSRAMARIPVCRREIAWLENGEEGGFTGKERREVWLDSDVHAAIYYKTSLSPFALIKHESIA